MQDERFKIAVGYAKCKILSPLLGAGYSIQLMQQGPPTAKPTYVTPCSCAAQLQKEEYYLVYVIAELVESLFSPI